MATLHQQLQIAQSMDPNHLTNVLFNVLRNFEKDMAQLNRDQIFNQSSDIFGKPLGVYSEATEYITTNEALLGKGTRIKKAGEKYDFKQQGVFLNSIFAKVNDGFVVFGSNDPKLDEIFDNPNLLSTEFFGLTRANKLMIIKKKLTPVFLRAHKALYGL